MLVKDSRQSSAPYYVSLLVGQKGSGSRSNVYFEGVPVQKGFGLLDSLLRGVLTVGKALAPAALSAGRDVMADVSRGRDLRSSLKRRALQAGRRTATTLLKKKGGRKRRRRKPGSTKPPARPKKRRRRRQQPKKKKKKKKRGGRKKAKRKSPKKRKKKAKKKPKASGAKRPKLPFFA